MSRIGFFITAILAELIIALLLTEGILLLIAIHV
jgi:hypothetical protein